jgi:hypothetical protein
MPQQRMPTAPGGPNRIRVRWKPRQKDVEVLFDGQLIGQFADCEDLLERRPMFTPAGARIEVRWSPTQERFEVWLNMVRVRGDDRVYADVADAAVKIFTVGGAITVLATLLTLTGARGLYWDMIPVGAALLLLGRAVARGSRAALGWALWLMLADTAAVIFSGVMLEYRPGMVSLVLRIVLLGTIMNAYLSSHVDW